MKSLPFFSVVTAALLALALCLPSGVFADGGAQNKKPAARGGAKDGKKDSKDAAKSHDKDKDDKNKKNQPAPKKEDKKTEPEKKPESHRKTEEAKKPDPHKKPDRKPEPHKKPDRKPEPEKKSEVAKKPEPNKPAPAGGATVAVVTYDMNKAANFIGRDEALEKVRAALKENPNAKFVIIGHADDSPYAVANKEISENRANFLASHLRTHGIPKDRVESRGVGNTQAVKGQPNRRAVVEMKR